MRLRVLVLSVLTLIVIGGGSVWAWRNSVANHSEADSDRLDKSSSEEKTIVVLTEAKRLSAGLEIDSIQTRSLQQSVTVPGRVQYDDTRHVEIRTATDCVLSKVLVKPGDHVQAGQVLAVLSSPEIGTARANVLQRQADLKLAERAASWERETSDNVLRLVKAIDTRRPLKELRDEFESRKLGDNRASLLTAYARWELAQGMAASLDRSAAVLPERTVRERLNEVESAQASIKAVCEQSTFDSIKRCDTAQAAVKDARRRLEIVQQQLTTLLGYREEPSDSDSDSDQQPSSLSLVECRAPIAGTIERKTFSVTERAKPGDTLFVLADTSRLWIAADLREREWEMLKIGPDVELMVESPALPNRPLVAKLNFVGREVSPESHAIPLVATIDNADGLLRPGLFVRVTIPAGEAVPRLAVPAAAVVEHDRQKFVFVRDADDTFHRVNITTGLESNGLIEITHGLVPGVPVVTRGAFVLKSELLLEAE